MFFTFFEIFANSLKFLNTINSDLLKIIKSKFQAFGPSIMRNAT